MEKKKSAIKPKSSLPEERVAGQLVAKNWLQGQSDQEYRQKLHAAFERAQLQLQLRKAQTWDKKEVLMQRIQVVSEKLPSDYDQQQRIDHAVCNPIMPDLHEERHRLVKISRSCSKNPIERFFKIDSSNEQFVYYENSNAVKPKKKVNLIETRVSIEQYSEMQEADKKKWSDPNNKCRVRIGLKSRKFQPVYYYAESLHDAKVVKNTIDYILGQDAETLKQVVKTVNIMYRVKVFQAIYSRLLTLRSKRIQLQNTLSVLSVMADNYKVDQREMFIQWHNELQKQAVKEEPEVKQVPKIWSTVRHGKVSMRDYFLLRTFTRVERLMLMVKRKMMKRRAQRDPTIQDMIKKKLTQKLFQCNGGQYRVSDSILENMHRIGDIPYVITDIANIAALKIEGDNIVIFDSKKNEYLLPINEVCYMATNYGFKPQSNQEQQFKMQLRGRKINLNVEMIGENILPQQIGLERYKASRLNGKSIIKISLKKLNIPALVRDQLNDRIVYDLDEVMLRLRFEIGEFYCYTVPISLGKDYSPIDLKDDLSLDLHDAKYVKISLISLHGRSQNHPKIINEYVNEEVLCFVNLRVVDFEDQLGELMYHVPFDSKLFYNPKENKASSSQNQIVLTTAIAILQVNGASLTNEMEGNQLLVGKLCIYKKQFIARVISVNRNQTCSIQILDTQPNSQQIKNKTIENVSIKQDITLIESYGMSLLNMDNLPQNYQHGQFEWNLDVTLTYQNIQGLLTKLSEAINSQQAKLALTQRTVEKSKKGQNRAFVCGRIQLSVMSAQNLANSDKTAPDVYVQISVQDTKRQSNAKFMDIANEVSFIQCKQNSDEIISKTFNTSIIKQNNNPTWVSTQNPQGECFDLGMFMKKYPHFILLEVYHQKKKSRFGGGNADVENELIGYTELHTESIISLDDYGQEYYMFLEDSINRSSIIKLRTLFVPSKGTIERLNLDPQKSVFKNAQQFLFYKVLHLHQVYDEFGYLIPLGKYMPELDRQDDEHIKNQTTSSNVAGGEQSLFQKRYEQFSPEHKRHKDLKDRNPLRPKAEENVHCFKQLWLFSQHQNRNMALIDRQRLFWEEYMTDLMSTPEDEALLDDELKSIRSKLTNTTKMMSSKYRKRSKQLKNQMQQQQEGTSTQTTSAAQKTTKKGSKFSVLFVGQWEKNESWKYVDIWYLVKFGIPLDLRVSLWKDLLRRQIHEQYEYVFYKRNENYADMFNANISNYENMKAFSQIRDSPFHQQIENDVKEFKFPGQYLGNMSGMREDRIESERLQMYQILKVYDLWAHEFCKRRHKIMVYNKGILAIIQRLLTIMTEEDAFWALVGMVKAFNNVLFFDFKGPAEGVISDQHQHFSPYLSRRVAYKNEMTILNCIIKLHYPAIFEKLKSLGMPIEWYFYEPFSQFFAYSFSSDLVLRLWDMIVFNLSTNQVENRKRALWYLLAIPLYMIQVNSELILRSQTPGQVKQLLIDRTPSLNYNPNLFIDEMLQIIKIVFVRKGNMFNKLLNLDKANQLEGMRRDIEQEALSRFSDDLALNKKISDYVSQRHIELNSNNIKVNKAAHAQGEPLYDMTVTIIGFRNIMLPQLEDEKIQINIVFQCDEEFQTPILEINVPTDNEQAMMQYLPKEVALQTLVMGPALGKKLKIKVVQRADGIHQHEMGSGLVSLSMCVSSSVPQHFTVKLFGNQDCHNAYIDLKVQMVQKAEKKSSCFSVQGFKKAESDISNIDKDDEVIKQLQPVAMKAATKLLITQTNSKATDERIIRQIVINEQQISDTINYTTDAIKSNIADNMQQLQNMAPLISNIVQDLGLPKAILEGTSNLTQILTRITLLGSQKEALPDIIQSLYSLFGQHQKQIIQLNLNDLKRTIIQMFRAALYPVPNNELWNMVSLGHSRHQSYTQVFKVSQQVIKDDTMSSNFFDKIVSGLTTQEKTTFNPTDTFRQTLNQVIRLTGFVHQIPMSVEPFNSLNFWLRGNSEIKKQPSLLCVILIDQNGDHHIYKFKFNATGMFEATNNTANVLPLVIGGTPAISKEDFANIIAETPMISDFVRQELFLSSQLHGTSNICVDTDKDYQIAFIDVGKKFIFKFSHSVDKQDDFTVDQSQMMRLAKGDISQIYTKQKNPQDGSITIEVNLSSLQQQDTFIWIKERMRMAFDFIVQSENISDAPILMSSKYQFLSKNMPQGQSYYSPLDRLMDVTNEKETKLELVRVAADLDNEQNNNSSDEQYDSFGLYTHSDSTKEWRPCRIVLKNQAKQGYEPVYRVAFQHEPDQTYTLRREDILLSYLYKRTQENYYKEEIQEFLEKLDKEEVEIAEVLKEQDRRGMQGVGSIDEVKRKLQYDGDEGLKIANQDLDDKDDVEKNEIKQQMEDSYVMNSYYESGN